MHVLPRQLLQSHTHCLLQTQIGLANHVGLPRQSGSSSSSTSRAAAYATVSSAAVDEGGGMEKEHHHHHRTRSKNPFPYPKHPNPTPYQIFHLPVGASQAQIKARYYELVRAHHPDSHHTSGIGADVAHARFRTIKASYDFLSGKTLTPHPNARPTPSPQNFDPYMHELARRRRAYYASQGRYQNFDENGESTGYTQAQRPVDDGYDESGKKERIILALGVVSLLAGLFPTVPGTLISTFAPTTTTTAVPPSDASSSTSASASSSTVPADAKTSSAPDTIPPAAAKTTSSTPASPTSTGSFSYPFFDLDRGHSAAVTALVQAREETREVGAERREGVRRRVKEINDEAAVAAEANSSRSTSRMSSGDADPERGSEPVMVKALCRDVPVSANGVEDTAAAVVESDKQLRTTPLSARDSCHMDKAEEGALPLVTSSAGSSEIRPPDEKASKEL